MAEAQSRPDPRLAEALRRGLEALRASRRELEDERAAREDAERRLAEAIGRAKDAGTAESGPERVQELEAALRKAEQERDRLARQKERAERDLAAVVDLRSSSDVIEGGLGNHLPVEAYRNVTLKNTIVHLNNLGLTGQMHGTDATRFLLRTAAAADLAVMYATPPSTVEEAERRESARILLTSPAAAEVLAGHEEWHERWREDLIGLILGAGASETTWELVRRSPSSVTDEKRRTGAQ